MRVGFTGTQHGMTNEQLMQIHMLLGDLKTAGATEVSHGMCIGSDDQFHEMAKALKYFTVGVPGVTALGQVKKRATMKPDLVMSAKPFLIRNRDIVKESDVLLATPNETTEQMRGSGTWATIRYAREVKKPLVIVFPDGSGSVEFIPGITTIEVFRELCCEWVPSMQEKKS